MLSLDFMKTNLDRSKVGYVSWNLTWTWGFVSPFWLLTDGRSARETFPCRRTLVVTCLRLPCACESLGDFIKIQILVQSMGGRAWDSALRTSCRVVLMLLVPGSPTWQELFPRTPVRRGAGLEEEVPPISYSDTKLELLNIHGTGPSWGKEIKNGHWKLDASFF